MSEIICSYTINNDASTSAYFITDSRATFNQFSEFITSNIYAEDFLIRDSTQQIISNTEQLKAGFASALQSGNAFSIILERVQPESMPEPEPEPESEPEPEEKKKESLFGPITQNIFAQFGIEVEENIDPRQMLRSLPFPFSVIAQARLEQVCNEPESLEEIVRSVAACLNVPFEELFAEAQTTLAMIKQRLHSKACQESERKEQAPIEKKADVPVEQEPKEVKEVVHFATCDRCEKNIVGIRYKCLNCPDYDLCSSCEEIQSTEFFHDKDHVFAKMYKATPFRPQFAQFPRMSHCRIFKHGVAPIFCPVVPQGERPQGPKPKGAKFQRLNALEKSVEKLQEQIRTLQNQ